MRSVPPRGSRWVVDGVAMTPREYSVLPSDRCGSRPTRYRVVVLTSSPSKHCFLSNTLMEHYLLFGFDLRHPRKSAANFFTASAVCRIRFSDCSFVLFSGSF